MAAELQKMRRKTIESVLKKTSEKLPEYPRSGKRQEGKVDVVEDREQWRELVALASVTESSWTMNTS